MYEIRIKYDEDLVHGVVFGNQEYLDAKGTGLIDEFARILKEGKGRAHYEAYRDLFERTKLNDSTPLKVIVE
jgi:hypothetical protein